VTESDPPARRLSLGVLFLTLPIHRIAGREEPGRLPVLWRSLGSLSRAIAPRLAGVVLFLLGSQCVFVGAAALAAAALRRQPLATR
jgi:hypothetical protein